MVAHKAFKSEAELVEATRDWLVAEGWDVYFEVAPWGPGAKRADIIATKGDLVTIVECKMSLSLAVLSQCNDWKNRAHYIWASIPGARKNDFSIKITEQLGIGLVMIGSRFSKKGARVLLQPAFCENPELRKIRRVLTESQKQVAAGANGGFNTPFRMTCNDLIALVQTSGGKINVKDAVAGIKHHYRSASSAKNSLVKRTEQGIIPGISVIREGSDVFFVSKK